MSISEQVKEIRAYAYAHEASGDAIYGTAGILYQAADTIEAISAKLQAANTDNGSGWIPCSERMPEENQNVIACFAHGTVTELRFYDKKFHGIYEYDEKVIAAWRPLPKAYGELHEP